MFFLNSTIGGVDGRGGPVITFPGQNPTLPEPPPQDIAACLQYLASIPRYNTYKILREIRVTNWCITQC